MILPVFPILLLLTAAISIVLYHRTRQDIHLVLAFSSAIVCFLWGLMIAHWSIHLLSLLILVCFRTPVFKSKPIQVYNK
jgi:hypothetical protein